jgi:transposase-like protein
MKRAITLCQARTLLALYAHAKGRMPEGDPLALWEGAPPSDEAGRMVEALADLAGVPVRRKGRSLSVRLADRPALDRVSNPDGDDGGDTYLLPVRVSRRFVPDLAAAVKGLRGVTEEGFILLEAIERAAQLGIDESGPPRAPKGPVTRERLLREMEANHGSVTMAARRLGLGYYEAVRLRDSSPGTRAKGQKVPAPPKLSREYVEAVVARHGGSINAAAIELDVARSTVREWLRRPAGEGEETEAARVSPERVKGAIVQSGGSITAAAALLGIARSTLRGVVETHDPEGAWVAEGKRAAATALLRTGNPGGWARGEGEAARALQAVMDEIGLQGPPLDRRDNPGSMTEAELVELFVRERGRFAKRFPRVAEASIEVSEAPCSAAHGRCGFRNVAYCSWTGPDGAKKYQRVVVVRRLLSMPRENVVGVIRHELGHLADDHVSEGGAERRADEIAERVTGAKVRYDANDLQSAGACRTPPCRDERPGHLHQ